MNDRSTEEAPWKAGLAAARANVLPAAALQVTALVVVGAYYGAPSLRWIFDVLARWRIERGLLFSVGTTALCGGALPYLYLRLNRATAASYDWRSAIFLIAFFAYKGFEIDRWYRFLAWLVGNDTRFATLASKVFLDQCIWAPVWAVTSTAILFAWRDAGFEWAPVQRALRRRDWYRRLVLPTVIANFGLWVPITFLIFALPLTLQLPLLDLVLVFYTLLISHVTRARARDPIVVPT